MKFDSDYGALDFSNKNIFDEFVRVMKRFDGVAFPAESGSMSIFAVLYSHFIICDFFIQEGFDLGGIGPRDDNLLISAVSRQFTSYGSEYKYKTEIDRAASLFFGIIKNHGFHDANKRTAFLTLLRNLEILGLVPSINGKQLEDFAVMIADNQHRKKSRYRALVEKNDDDPDVSYISYYLKSNTRSIDNRNYVVTYRELNKILQSFGFELQNSNKNYIDVVRIKSKRRLFGFGKPEKTGVKVCQIAFPGMGQTVPKNTVSHVRRECGLDAKNQFDSGAFFKGLDPLIALVGRYNEPLRRLADR